MNSVALTAACEAGPRSNDRTSMREFLWARVAQANSMRGNFQKRAGQRRLVAPDERQVSTRAQLAHSQVSKGHSVRYHLPEAWHAEMQGSNSLDQVCERHALQKWQSSARRSRWFHDPRPSQHLPQRTERMPRVRQRPSRASPQSARTSPPPPHPPRRRSRQLARPQKCPGPCQWPWLGAGS